MLMRLLLMTPNGYQGIGCLAMTCAAPPASSLLVAGTTEAPMQGYMGKIFTYARLMQGMGREPDTISSPIGQGAAGLVTAGRKRLSCLTIAFASSACSLRQVRCVKRSRLGDLVPQFAS